MQLNNAIKNRWSPRGFSNKNITEEMIDLLFEAARWAPSSRNEQPWNYYYAVKDDTKPFNLLVDTLTGKNPEWAKTAQLLIVSVVKKNYDYKNKPNGKALHDIGAANVSIAIQASEMGLQAHQMGGFDKIRAAELLNLDIEYFEPVTIIAVGFQDDSQKNEYTSQRRIQHESRKNQKDFVFKL